MIACMLPLAMLTNDSQPAQCGVKCCKKTWHVGTSNFIAQRNGRGSIKMLSGLKMQGAIHASSSALCMSLSYELYIMIILLMPMV